MVPVSCCCHCCNASISQQDQTQQCVSTKLVQCPQASGPPRLDSLNSSTSVSASAHQGANETVAAGETTSHHIHADSASSADRGPRAKPRGLPSQVEQTVSRLSSSTAHTAHSEAAASGPAAKLAESAASARRDAAHVDGEELSNADELDNAEITGRGSAQREAQSASSSEASPVKGFSAGQGKPPLSPERQPLTSASTPKGPASIQAALTGVATPDVNVHCNPLFTEPLGGQQHSDERQQDLAMASHAADVSPEAAKAAEGVTDASSRHKAQYALHSPPSKLQESLRMLMRRHNEGS